MSDDNNEETVGDDAGASLPGSENTIDATIAEAEAIAAAAAMSPDEVLTVMRERDEFKGMLQRLQSDFENYRKRSLREQDTAAERAGEKVVNRLLPVLDTFELALTHEADPDNSPLAKMHDSLLIALESEGLERVAPEGLPFDPNQADAVMHEEGDADSPGPMVTQVLRAGYVWKGRVVRPAMVKVKG
jgi:molecular chaperone GrpE